MILFHFHTAGPTTHSTVYHLCLESMREPYGTAPSRVSKRMWCLLHWPAGSHTTLRAIAVILTMSMFKSKSRQSDTGKAWEPVLGWMCGGRLRNMLCVPQRRVPRLCATPLASREHPNTHTHALPACCQWFESGPPGKKRKSDPHGGAIKLLGDWQSSLKPSQASITAVTRWLLTSPTSSVSPQQHQRNLCPRLQRRSAQS